jgi:hypothetical protein
MNVQVVILGYSYRQIFRHIIDVNHASSATATLPKINICLYPKMVLGIFDRLEMTSNICVFQSLES